MIIKLVSWVNLEVVWKAKVYKGRWASRAVEYVV